MKMKFSDEWILTIIISGKCKRWLLEMTKEYNKDHNDNIQVSTCAQILLETMCMNYESKGLWKDTKEKKNNDIQ